MKIAIAAMGGDLKPVDPLLAPLTALRKEIDGINEQILGLLQLRAQVVLRIAELKRQQGLEGYDPRREDEMLHSLQERATGPFGPSEIRDVFQSIFRASLDIQDRERRRGLRVLSPNLVPPGGVRVGDVAIGGGTPVLFAGPCSVETEEQMETIATYISRMPVPKILRAGAFKPRTNPYTFQGLREEGLRILRETADRHGLAVVTEVLDTATLDAVAAAADMIQIGARNMYNTELLKAVGRLRKPVLLKRGFMATLDELLLSAEYIFSQGNEAVVLCERGIRTFETKTRNTLDISAIPLLKQETSLPVIVDLSHALGRRDILMPCARAAMAAGADGLMIETHHQPDQALSDGFQQICLEDLGKLVAALGWGDPASEAPAAAAGRRSDGRRTTIELGAGAGGTHRA
jgi:3-deoxy-7-phosphoheptulonate synthase/chorismate mutase